MRPPTAKSLILDLLLAASPGELSARDAIVACRLFEISENNARVALVRLSASGMVEGVGRGAYRLGPEARELADEVAKWRDVESRLRPWNGDYVVVATHSLVGSDRTTVRRRKRALAMLGFRELSRGLEVRPNNVDASVEVIRERLITLGMPRGALVFVGSDFDAKQTRVMKNLWDGKALTKSYTTLRASLDTWRARAHTLPPDVAARESFLLGGRAIRHVVLDPMLPEPYVDAGARHAFITSVKRFDEAGREIWQRFFSQAADEAQNARSLTH